MKKTTSHACIANVKHNKATNPRNDNQIISQLVSLTKQNQRLKEDNELLTIELSKLLNSKNKYKMMYKDIKNDLHSYHSKNKFKLNNCGSTSRQNTGKIYSQPKINFYPHTLNQNNHSQKKVKETDENFNNEFMRNQNNYEEGQEEFMLRISKQVMMALDALPKILATLMSIQNYTKKHHFNLGQLQLSLNSFQNQIRQKFFNIQYTHLNKRQKQDGSGTSAKSISQPIKDLFRNEHISPPSRGNVEENPNFQRNIEYDQAEEKKSGKLVKLGMSKSLKAHKQKHSKQGSMNIQQGNNSWKQLNEIGRQLKSWRVSDEDSLLLNNSHENMQNQYQINSDQQ